MAHSIRVIAAVVVTSMLLAGAGCRLERDDQFPSPAVGSTATFQEYPRWDISGSVTVVDAHTVRLNDFTFHGEGLTTDIRLQRGDKLIKVLSDISATTYDHATVDLTIPNTVALSDFNLVTVYAPALSSPVSGASFGGKK